MDGKDVGCGTAHHVLRDASLDEALEEPLLAHPYDDQVGTAVVRERHDRLRGLAGESDELGGQAALLEVRAGLVEPLAPVAPLLAGLVRVGRRDVGDDQLRPELLGQVGCARQRPAGRIVEGDEDLLDCAHGRRVGAPAARLTYRHLSLR